MAEQGVGISFKVGSGMLWIQEASVAEFLEALKLIEEEATTNVTLAPFFDVDTMSAATGAVINTFPGVEGASTAATVPVTYTFATPPDTDRAATSVGTRPSQGARPATDKQREWLRKKGHPNPDTATFEDAKSFLDKAFAK